MDYLLCGDLPYPAWKKRVSAQDLRNRRIRRYFVCRLKRSEARDFSHVRFTTVSAFSNYNGGTILFGVDDDGNVKGLPDVKQACLDIENKINDSISPQPNYMLELQNNDQTIKLTVKSGLQKPYLYKSKAYKRNDTATIEVDTLEFSRLVL